MTIVAPPSQPRPIDAHAALALGPRLPLEIEPIEVAAPLTDEVLVRIVASGVCHTDVVMIDDRALPWPAVLGHEGAGIVIATGAGVTSVTPGDTVVLCADSCGVCASCRSGSSAFCEDFLAVNLGGGRHADGRCTHRLRGAPIFGRFFGQSSFASVALVSKRSTIKIPPDMPLDVAAPFGCAVLTGAGSVINTLRPAPDSSLAVFGLGAVGLCALMAARIAGCKRLIGIDTNPARLALARELGATETIDARSVDAATALRKTGGVDYVVEAAGSTNVMEQSIQALAIGGTAVLLGVVGAADRTLIDPTTLKGRGLTVKGSLLGGPGGDAAHFIPRLIEYWRRGDLPIERLIQRYAFADINRAIDDARSGYAIKPVVFFPQS